MTDSDAGNPARPVRDEDSFDVAAVSAWLRAHAADGFRETVAADPEVRQFPGGASNLTYLLRYPDRDLILRRPPVGRKAAGAHDMGREFRIQSALAPVFPLVPAMVGLCDDESVLGSDFYVMDRLDGTILRQDFPDDLTLAPDQVATLCRNAVDVLIDLHRVDATRPDLAAFGKGEGYVARQVSGWSTRFRAARTEDVGDFEAVMAWLDEHQPADVGTCVIHNDFRFDNLVLDADDPLKVIGMLDWEMATLGDPLMDLGGATAYWVEAGDDDFFQMFRRQPTTAPGMWTRAELVEHYCAQTGIDMTPERWRFYEVFGLFRLAVIAQQIYYRYFHGQTTNEAYAVFGDAARYLEHRCQEVMA
ncbi:MULTISPECIES: phosphotransferase family protein [unclassified Nocardioides]|uniref:phosphotransferase family protein n=1 Tax=unclassified Nocardioides TaxID=2615069 RepID=UPI0007016F70|nr:MULTISPECIES: phosphotransferase family protein [unclassified Nocardioides]KQY62595.1 aminoglycoside phosphotransferase [Nocardioides sp. Root140]KQZ76005.1 aminoglycoside phosphotransferase [Nocardioides sp. Root151]KRF15078.1 aminoglycoside phosphotransferase [Nocardioides sp. Soil796]